MLHLFKTKPIAFVPLLLGLVEGSSTLWHHLSNGTAAHACQSAAPQTPLYFFAGVQLPEGITRLLLEPATFCFAFTISPFFLLSSSPVSCSGFPGSLHRAAPGSDFGIGVCCFP